jgi:hypothetical protein
VLANKQVNDTGKQPHSEMAADPSKQRKTLSGATGGPQKLSQSSSDCSDSTTIKEVKLSPARHIPKEKPNKQAVIGVLDLAKL